MLFRPYDRLEAVIYAHRWAYGRNPAFYDYEEIGGDCTNYASQCIYVGTGVMNYTPTFGWYYINSNDKSPSWTGVEFLRDFLVREERSAGAGSPGDAGPLPGTAWRCDTAKVQWGCIPAFTGGGTAQL